MSTLTTPDNLVVPVGTDGIAPLQTVLANMQNSVQQAFVARGQQAFARYNTKTLLPTSGNVVWQHATVTADPVATNNGDYQWNGTAWVQALRMDRGYRGGATDANGRIIVTHGLGSVPAAIQLQGGRSGGVPNTRLYSIDQSKVTSTNFEVIVSQSVNGATLNGNPVDFWWTVLS